MNWMFLGVDDVKINTDGLANTPQDANFTKKKWKQSIVNVPFVVFERQNIECYWKWHLQSSFLRWFAWCRCKDSCAMYLQVRCLDIRCPSCSSLLSLRLIYNVLFLQRWYLCGQPHGLVLLCPWPFVPSQFYFQIQSDHCWGEEAPLTTRMPQCFTPGRHFEEVRWTCVLALRAS